MRVLKMGKERKVTLSDFTIRPAEKSDYDGVIAISHGMYRGFDIIPSVYFEYLDDTNRVFYVAVNKKDRKVAALVGARIIDNGETYEGEGARTDPQYRGTGLYLHDAVRNVLIREGALPKWPNLKRIRIVTIGVKEISRNPDYFNIPFSIRCAVDLIDTPKSNFLQQLHLRQGKLSIDRLPLQSINRASAADIEYIFKHYASNKALFPSGIIVRDSQYFSVGTNYLSNIHYLLGDRLRAVFMSRSVDGTIYVPTSISFGTGIESGVTLKTMRYCIDYYGLPDMDLIRGHVMKHMLEIPSCCSESPTAEVVRCYIFIPKHVIEIINVDDLRHFVSYESGTDMVEMYQVEQCVSDCRIAPRNWISSSSKL